MKNLKLLREKYNLSQQKLGEAVQLSGNTIGQYEKGIREPNIETLIKLADFFSVSVDFLIGHDSNEIKQKPNEKQLLQNDIYYTLCNMNCFESQLSKKIIFAIKDFCKDYNFKI